MSRSRFINVVVSIFLILELCGKRYADQCDLDKVWDSLSSTSESSRPFYVLNLDQQKISEIEGLASVGRRRLSMIYRLKGAYVLQVRKKDGGTSYLYIKRGGNERKVLRHLDVGTNRYLNINITAAKLRFAPISRLAEKYRRRTAPSQQNQMAHQKPRLAYCPKFD